MRNYIVRLKDNSLHCFYFDDQSIKYKSYEQNKWSKEKTVKDNVRKNFSVNISADGKFYIFCQDTGGNIILCTKAGNEFLSRVILSKNADVFPILFNAIITEQGMCLLYNTPASEDKSHYLMRQQLNDQGQWSQANRIDKFTALNNLLYLIQHLTVTHLLVFYQMQTTENILGYRELTTNSQGKFNSYYSGNLPVIDQSVLTTNNAVHVLYVVKGLFASRLVYRKKEDEAFSQPLILWEGLKIDSVCLYIVRDNLYASFRYNDQLYVCLSEDKGTSFSKPTVYRKKFCLNPEKAYYLSEAAQEENAFFIRDIYTDPSHPWDIQLIPDIYEDFYPNKLSAYEKSLAEKDRQIAELTGLLEARNNSGE